MFVSLATFARITMVLAICAEVSGLCCPEHSPFSPAGRHHTHLYEPLLDEDDSDQDDEHPDAHAGCHHAVADQKEQPSEEPVSSSPRLMLPGCHDHLGGGGHCQFQTDRKENVPPLALCTLELYAPLNVLVCQTAIRVEPVHSRPGGACTSALPVRLLLQAFLL